MSDRAAEIHRDAVVVDAHNDLLLTTVLDYLGERATFKQRWIPELREGGVDVQVVPVYTEAHNPEAALRETLRLIAAFHREVGANPGDVAACISGDEIRRAVNEGKIAMVLALEGASCLGPDASLVPLFHRLGVRMISFTHMGRSWLADGSGENGTGGRLTRAGVQVLAEMERLGIVMDVSHLGVAGTDHVLELAHRPVIASHSSAHALRAHHRNLTDEQLRAIAATGGVIGVNLLPAFIDPTTPTIDRAVDHVEHMAEIAGAEHVGLGPDFIVEIFDDTYPKEVPLIIEGVDARQPIPGLFSSRHLPALTEAMVRRGFTEAQLEGILGANFLRVFDEVLGVPS
jgi:membrane dipeptidase